MDSLILQTPRQIIHIHKFKPILSKIRGRVLLTIMRNKAIDYKEIILKTVFGLAVLSVAVMAPNALRMFSFLKKNNRAHTTFYLKKKTNELIKKGFISQSKNGLVLTSKGQIELTALLSKNKMISRKWKGFWTVISFDFPEKKKMIRDSVRFQLKRIGFIQLQKSVWVFPYDCPELIYLIKTEWKLKDELVYIRAKYISREKKLKEYFDL